MRVPPPEPRDGPDGVARAALEAALDRVRARIRSAAAAAGRPPPLLLPVTKSVPAEVALALADLLAPPGAPVELAENRADGLAAKAAAFEAAGRPVRWHFIGHVQRNKARRILEHADVLHSVDSLRLLEALARLASDRSPPLDVYLQVDFTGEEAKGGLDGAGAREALRVAGASPGLRPLGLMAMGPRDERPGRTTADVFAQVATLARELEGDAELAALLPDGRCALSLGMSGDLEEAVAAGSDVLRIGADLFTDLPATAPTGGADSAGAEGPA